jgi:uncharacterized protein
MNKTFEMIIAATLLSVTATAAQAMQRDPAYQSARQQGLVGEKTDGYLGFVSPPSAAIKALVDDLNIKRKAVYTKEADLNSATVVEMAFRNGCRLIGERTSPGEKYQKPDGTWATKTDAKPDLDPRCP